MSLTTSHYSANARLKEALARLITAYPEGPTLYQLAPLDQLHIGGIKASEHLAQLIGSLAPASVLDIGSGLGGLLRVCHAHHAHCQYFALDITPALSVVNRKLNQISGCDAIQVVTGDAHHLPFADASIDLIIMQHSLLNIPDKAQALAECHRVLSKGGHLVLHEVVAGTHPEAMRYPVPWAQSAALSFLDSSTALEARITESGFKITSSQDWTADALKWRQRQAQKNTDAPAVVSPADVLGSDFTKMGTNVASNLANHAIGIVQLVASRA